MVPSPRNQSPAAGVKPSDDIIPEPATTERHQENFHTGRGGEGNVHRDKYGGHSGPREEQGSLIDRAKHAMGMDKKKHGDSPLHKETSH